MLNRNQAQKIKKTTKEDIRAIVSMLPVESSKDASAYIEASEAYHRVVSAKYTGSLHNLTQKEAYTILGLLKLLGKKDACKVISMHTHCPNPNWAWAGDEVLKHLCDLVVPWRGKNADFC